MIWSVKVAPVPTPGWYDMIWCVPSTPVCLMARAIRVTLVGGSLLLLCVVEATSVSLLHNGGPKTRSSPNGPLAERVHPCAIAAHDDALERALGGAVPVSLGHFSFPYSPNRHREKIRG